MMINIPPDALEFTLSYEALSAERLDALLVALAHHPTLETLSLKMDRLGEIEIPLIIKSLNKNRSLKTLSLDWNNIGEKAANAIARLLIEHDRLTKLSLCSTSMSDTAGVIIAEALSNHCSLKELLMRVNNISSLTVTRLEKALRSNGTLQEIGYSIYPNNEVLNLSISTRLRRNKSWDKIHPLLTLLTQAYQVNTDVRANLVNLHHALNAFSQAHGEQDESLVFSFPSTVRYEELVTLPSIIKKSLVKCVIDENKPSILYINFSTLKQTVKSEFDVENTREPISSSPSELVCHHFTNTPANSEQQRASRRQCCVLL